MQPEQGIGPPPRPILNAGLKIQFRSVPETEGPLSMVDVDKFINWFLPS